jgi:hypothetical protein
MALFSALSWPQIAMIVKNSLYADILFLLENWECRFIQDFAYFALAPAPGR